MRALPEKGWMTAKPEGRRIVSEDVARAIKLELKVEALEVQSFQTLPVEKRAKYRFSWEQAAVTAGGTE